MTPDHVIKGALDALTLALDNGPQNLHERVSEFWVRVYSSDTWENNLLVCFERSTFVGVTSGTYWADDERRAIPDSAYPAKVEIEGIGGRFEDGTTFSYVNDLR